MGIATRSFEEKLETVEYICKELFGYNAKDAAQVIRIVNAYFERPTQ